MLNIGDTTPTHSILSTMAHGSFFAGIQDAAYEAIRNMTTFHRMYTTAYRYYPTLHPVELRSVYQPPVRERNARLRNLVFFTHSLDHLLHRTREELTVTQEKLRQAEEELVQLRVNQGDLQYEVPFNQGAPVNSGPLVNQGEIQLPEDPWA